MAANPVNRWQAFFDGHAPDYLKNEFTRNTLFEVDFLLEELQPPLGGWILDVGCGVGRHSLELARRGFQVTGVDLSEGMLAQARQAGPSVEWVHPDATAFRATRPYDAAICLCEGAFGLVGDGEDPLAHDTAILRNVHAALRPGGGFLLTTLNGYRSIRRGGNLDPATMIEIVEDPELGTYRERCHIPPELALLMRQVGFEVLHLWGGTAGNWVRGRPVDLDEIEFMVVARKRPDSQ